MEDRPITIKGYVTLCKMPLTVMDDVLLELGRRASTEESVTSGQEVMLVNFGMGVGP